MSATTGLITRMRKKPRDYVDHFGGMTFTTPEAAVRMLEMLFELCALEARKATYIELADSLADIRVRVAKEKGSCEELEWSETELRAMVHERREERGAE